MIAIRNIMAFLGKIILCIVICAFSASCLRQRRALPSGDVEVSYTSVRGASPQIVDYFIILSGSSVGKPTSNGRGVACFIIPPEMDAEFRRMLTEILDKYEWDEISSKGAKSADAPFRRISLRVGSYAHSIEIHEQAGNLLSDHNLQRFYLLVSEIRLLGETCGIKLKIEDPPSAKNLDMPSSSGSIN